MAEAKAKIAIVEDDGTLAFMMDELCTSAGYEVVGCVGSAEEAEALIADCGPDVLILDFNLDGERNGLELIGDVRETCPDMHTVLVTGWDINDIASRMEGAQPDRILRKPVKPTLLMDVIEQFRSAKANGSDAPLPEPPPMPRVAGRSH